MAKQSEPTLHTAYRRLVFLLGCLLLLAVNSATFPLPNTDNAWAHGFAHPLEGWDHIITMLAVGIWAAQLRGHAVWLLPLAFVGVMGLGGIAGTADILIPAAEGMILLSCAVFTLFIAHRIKFSNRVNVVIVAFFAFFHGFAHGQEISASASLFSYSVGFMLATLLLHGAGILIAKLVLFCATCCIALLLPTLAQAAQAHSNSPTARFVDINGNPFLSISSDTYDSDNERFIVDDDALHNKKPPGDISPGKPYSGTQKLKRQTIQLNASIASKTSKADSIRGNISLENQIIENPFSQWWQQLLPKIYDNSLSHAASFRHYFPDINYSPGQTLLSNGVGLTSPPSLIAGLFLLAFITCLSACPFRRYYVSHFLVFAHRLLQKTTSYLLIDIALTIMAMGQISPKSHEPTPLLVRNLITLISNKATSVFYPPLFYRLDSQPVKARPSFCPDKATSFVFGEFSCLYRQIFATLYTT